MLDSLQTESVDPRLALAVGVLGLGVLAAVLWPRGGLWHRLVRSREFSDRVFREDALKHVYNLELKGRRPTLQSLAGALQVALGRAADITSMLQRGEWLEVAGEEMRLTPKGRRYALNVLRAHRLWEQHLAEKTGVQESEWHRLAENQEHLISPAEADLLSADLGHPVFDPHGDPIPNAEGQFARVAEGRPLASLALDEWGRITHIEDEPESVCAQVRAMGLYPGTAVRLLESSARRVRLFANGEEHVLAPVVAANVSVRPLGEVASEEVAAGLSLASLGVGERATVARLSPRCRGAERRRLLDFGILPGTPIVAELVSPVGNLVAYRVRDTLIALRQEQAAWIYVRPAEGAAA